MPNSTGVRIVGCLGSLCIAAAIWLPTVHVLFRPRLTELAGSTSTPVRAREMAQYHLRQLQDDMAAQRADMRTTNAEWDLMGRTYLVLALANLSRREVQQAPEYLRTIDAMLEDTLRIEAQYGQLHFLMPYALSGAWQQQPARSQFVDSEIALMLAVRQTVSPESRFELALAKRLRVIQERMEASPVLCAESYPDECSVFCNTMALEAMRISDACGGTDHSAFARRWVEIARQQLVDSWTGLLLSSFTWYGEPRDGPEGSSIWMAAHCLQLVDPAFAAEQYAGAKRELGRELLGFGFAREWPPSWQNAADVDSGPIVPGLDISAGSSGLACVASGAFGDAEFQRKLITTLEFAAFPIRDSAGLRYAASNQVGDAVLLYSIVQGPLWHESRSGAWP